MKGACVKGFHWLRVRNSTYMYAHALFNCLSSNMAVDRRWCYVQTIYIRLYPNWQFQCPDECGMTWRSSHNRHGDQAIVVIAVAANLDMALLQFSHLNDLSFSSICVQGQTKWFKLQQNTILFSSALTPLETKWTLICSMVYWSIIWKKMYTKNCEHHSDLTFTCERIWLFNVVLCLAHQLLPVVFMFMKLM